MTAHLPTTLLTLLISAPLLAVLAYAGIGKWRQASALVDEGLRIPGSDRRLCAHCTRRQATQFHHDGDLCIECWVHQPDLVPGGVEALCVSCTDDALNAWPAVLPHPDGGPGGVCRPCWEALR